MVAQIGATAGSPAGSSDCGGGMSVSTPIWRCSQLNTATGGPKPCHAASMSDDSGRTGGDAVEGRPRWRPMSDELRRSLESQPAANDDTLAHWLTTQGGVSIHSYGGFAPECWRGDVDGQSFSFRERHGQWVIEIDHRPAGRFIQTVAGTEPDGTAIYRTRELEVGELIASGTTDVAGYGATAVERAQFIVETIRTHLTRQSCGHYLDQLEAIDTLLGVQARWCAHCGAHLPER